MIKQTLNPIDMNREYGIQLQRFYPSPQIKQFTPFGSSWGIVEKSECTTPHSHHEAESFYITNGSGYLTIDNQTSEVAAGDVIFIPPFSEHTLHNEKDEPLKFISVWWELPKEEDKNE
jgi:methionyl-tRNA synthetase